LYRFFLLKFKLIYWIKNPDPLDKNFFGNLVKKEINEKNNQDLTDVGSVADQETVITEEEFQPINRQAIQSSSYFS